MNYDLDPRPVGRPIKGTAKRLTDTERRIRRLPLRYQMFMTGELTVKDMDDEELLKGRLKDEQGIFRRPPSWIPEDMLQAMHKEYIRRQKIIFRGAISESYKGLEQIIKNELYSAEARGKAATVLLDRLEGPVKQEVEVSGEVKAVWEEAIEGAIVVMDIEDAEVVE